MLLEGGRWPCCCAPSCSSRACSSSGPNCSTSSPPCMASSWCSAPSCRPRGLRELDDSHADRRSDMAFARMNNFSFWLLVAAIMLTASFFVPGGATAAGWTLYAPLSLQMGPHGPGHLRHAHHGRVLHHGRDQHHRHRAEHARARHDADEDAAVLLDLADHRLPAAGRDAGAGRRHHHGADRPPLRHRLFNAPPAATRCCTSTCSGSSGTPRFTS